MRPLNLMCAKSARNGVITIEGLGDNRVKLMGSSVAKFVPTSDDANSFTFSLKEGDSGFVAVRAAVYPFSKHPQNFFFFLRVEWKKNEVRPFVNFESPWIPQYPDRIGEINYFGLTTEIDGVAYTSDPWGKSEKRYVSDHNLICRYLSGNVDANAVKSAATELIEEEEAKKRIPRLETKIKELELVAEDSRKKIQDMEKLLSERDKDIDSYMRWNVDLEKNALAARDLAQAVKEHSICRFILKKKLEAFNGSLPSL